MRQNLPTFDLKEEGFVNYVEVTGSHQIEIVWELNGAVSVNADWIEELVIEVDLGVRLIENNVHASEFIIYLKLGVLGEKFMELWDELTYGGNIYLNAVYLEYFYHLNSWYLNLCKSSINKSL